MESIIVVTSSGNKENILKEISNKGKLINLKFYSFNDLKKGLFFDYDNEALLYIMNKYHVNLDIARVYLENMYFLKDVDDYKVKFLNALKEELILNNLLKINENFKKFLKKHKIIVYGYSNLSKEQLLILEDLNWELKNDEKDHYKPSVYEAFDMKEEIIFVLDEISKLIKKGIDISKIKIIINSDYQILIKRYFKIYNIPLNIKGNNTYFSTFIAQEFLANYDDYSINDNILNLEDKYSNINDLITIINKSAKVTDKTLRKEFIINDLNKTHINSNKYEKAVTIANLEDNFADDDFVFLLGFNMNDYPKIEKDEVKELLNIDRSEDKNKLIKENIKEKITKIKNIWITYKRSNNGTTSYPSVLINDLGLEVKKIELNKKISYSKLNTKLEYGMALDNKNKYNVIDEFLGAYQNSITIPYQTYDNRFSGLNINNYKESLNKELVMAYTSLEMYNECAFKYYLSKILKIDIFLENFNTIIGSIVHHILEKALVEDIDIKKEIISFVKEKEYNLGPKEFFYLEKISDELSLTIKIIKDQAKHSALDKYLFEEELYVYKDLEDINITFKGLIDKVMYREVNDKVTLMVVDYKTGGLKLKLENLDYGLNMQLPIYLYLLKKSDRFKDATIAGFYLQKVLNNLINKSDEKPEKVREENLKLYGYSNSDEDILELIDDDYQNSTVLASLKYNKNGELSKTSKVLSDEEMDELTEEVELKINECLTKILKAEFQINPKVVQKENVACPYCKFKDICYMSKKDEVILGSDEE